MTEAYDKRVRGATGEHGGTMEGRIQRWDNIKFVLIFLVVLGHVCDHYVKESALIRTMWICIYSFHMPLFFFIAGLFSKRKIDGRQYTRIFPYFAMYVVSQILLLLSKMLFVNQYSIELLDTKDAPWFIFVLFFFYLITIVIRRFDHRYILVGSVLLACMAGYDESIGDTLQMARMVTFYPCFYLGYIMDEGTVRRKLSGRKWMVVSWLLILIGIAVVYQNIDVVYKIRPLLTGRNAFSRLKGMMYPLGALMRTGQYLLALVVGAMVIAAVPEKLAGGKLATLGRRSLQIYLLHRPCIVLLVNKLNISEVLYKIWPAHYHLLFAMVALLITMFCSLKLFEKPIRIVITPRMRM